MSKRISYSPHHDITPEREAAALGNVYRFIFDTVNRKGPLCRGGGPDETRGSEHEIRPVGEKYTRRLGGSSS